MSSPSKQLDHSCKLFVAKDEHKFSCAHMTIFADGTKERLHGHNFRVAVAVTIEAGTRELLDFARLKCALAGHCARLREHLLIPTLHPAVEILRREVDEIELRVSGRRYVLPADEVMLLPVANVVVEALAAYLWVSLEQELREVLMRSRARVLEVTVTEAPGQGATYCAPIQAEAP
ncbi:MAG: 6-carboxytetrahydropterin synthase [Polyangiaceae bacterium]|nr:6-carboxytetrahydropterin synthase [Polyangiaceae bacterium]